MPARSAAMWGFVTLVCLLLLSSLVGARQNGQSCAKGDRGGRDAKACVASSALAVDGSLSEAGAEEVARGGGGGEGADAEEQDEDEEEEHEADGAATMGVYDDDEDGWTVVLPNTRHSVQGWGSTNSERIDFREKNNEKIQLAIAKKFTGGVFKNRFEGLKLYGEDLVPDPKGCYSNARANGGTYRMPADSGEEAEFACNPPHFVIDMSDAKRPEERWAEVAQQEVIKTVLRIFLTNLENQGLYTQDMVEEAAEVCADTEDVYCKELQGFAAHSEVSLGHLVLLNYMYELQSMCTSVIMATSGGQVLHARTLDFDFVNFLKPLVVTAELKFNQDRTVQATIFAGHVGLLTGVVPGKFALTINQRDKGGMSEKEMHDKVEATEAKFRTEGLGILSVFKKGATVGPAEATQKKFDAERKQVEEAFKAEASREPVTKALEEYEKAWRDGEQKLEQGEEAQDIKKAVMTAFKGYATAWGLGETKLGTAVQQKKLRDLFAQQAGKGLGDGDLPVTVLAREVLATAPGYSEAVQRLSEDPILAPVYYIVSGSDKYQGTILTRSTNGVVDDGRFDLDKSHPVRAQANGDIEMEPVLPEPKFHFALGFTLGLGQKSCDLCSDLDPTLERSLRNALRLMYSVPGAETRTFCSSSAFTMERKGSLEGSKGYMVTVKNLEVLKQNLAWRLCKLEGGKFDLSKNVCIDAANTSQSLPFTLKGKCDPLHYSDIILSLNSVDSAKPVPVFPVIPESEKRSKERRVIALTQFYYGFHKKFFNKDHVDPWDLMWYFSFPTSKGETGDFAGTAHATIMTASNSIKFMLGDRSMATIVDWSPKHDKHPDDWGRVD